MFYLDIDLKDLLFSNPSKEREELLKQTQYAQPALFSLGYALFKLWTSWGVTPSVLLGHSIGEITAACAAEVFSLESGLKLVISRGKLMQSLPTGGGMVSVFCSKEYIKGFLEKNNKAVIIGSDCPEISKEIINQAFDSLDDND